MKRTLKHLLSLALALATVLSIFASSTQVHAATLKPGSSSIEVKRLEMNLIGLGYMSGTADKKYDSKTVKAVKKYQAANDLTADGIAGTKTLSSIKTKVKQLQMNLNGLGYKAGTVDGVYGGATKAAVIRYQDKNKDNKGNKLSKDGIAGIKTMNSIHDKVVNLQGLLNGSGYPVGKPDGVYGSTTKAAVKAIQESFAEFDLYSGTTYKQRVDGIADAATIERITTYCFENGG